MDRDRNPDNSVFAFMYVKEASLYFDRVHIITTFMDDAERSDLSRAVRSDNVRPFDDRRFISQIDDTIFLFGEAASASNRAGVDELFRVQNKRTISEWDWSPFDKYSSDLRKKYLEYFYWYVGLQYGVTGPSTLIAPEYFNDFDEFEDEESVDCVSLKLTSLNLVDATTAQWEQIREIRRDKDSQIALKRLRTLMAALTLSNSEQQMKEDLDQRIYEYEKSARKHGLDLRDGFLIKTISSSALATLLGGAGAILGQSLPAIAASAVPFSLSVGAAAIELIKERRNFLEGRRSDPIFYLIQARQRLQLS